MLQYLKDITKALQFVIVKTETLHATQLLPQKLNPVRLSVRVVKACIVNNPGY